VLWKFHAGLVLLQGRKLMKNKISSFNGAVVLGGYACCFRSAAHTGLGGHSLTLAHVERCSVQTCPFSHFTLSQVSAQNLASDSSSIMHCCEELHRLPSPHVLRDVLICEHGL
jgi:hypothetical protein